MPVTKIFFAKMSSAFFLVAKFSIKVETHTQNILFLGKWSILIKTAKCYFKFPSLLEISREYDILLFGTFYALLETFTKRNIQMNPPGVQQSSFVAP